MTNQRMPSPTQKPTGAAPSTQGRSVGSSPDASPGFLTRAAQAVEQSPLALLGALTLMFFLYMGLAGNSLAASDDILAAQQAAAEAAAASAPGYAAF